REREVLDVQCPSSRTRGPEGRDCDRREGRNEQGAQSPLSSHRLPLRFAAGALIVITLFDVADLPATPATRMTTVAFVCSLWYRRTARRPAPVSLTATTVALPDRSLKDFRPIM